jgi:hypothetical protein
VPTGHRTMHMHNLHGAWGLQLCRCGIGCGARRGVYGAHGFGLLHVQYDQHGDMGATARPRTHAANACCEMAANALKAGHRHCNT